MKAEKIKIARNFRNHKAMTLVELLVVVGISVAVLAAIMVIDLLVRRTFSFNTAFINVHSQARTAMDWLSRDIRWATQIRSDVIIDSVTYTTGDDELVLEVPSIDSDGNIIPGVVDYIVYFLDSTDTSKLTRIIDADDSSSRTDGNHTLALNINDLEFSSGGTALSSVADVTSVSKIDIDLETRQVATSGEVATEFLNSTVKLRNN